MGTSSLVCKTCTSEATNCTTCSPTHWLFAYTDPNGGAISEDKKRCGSACPANQPYGLADTRACAQACPAAYFVDEASLSGGA